jgi:chemotaxis response regulator CheB
MPGRDIVVVGASLGGVDALLKFAPALPAQLPAALFVALHMRHEGVLAEILTRRGNLRASYAVDRERIRRGRLYLAPGDKNLYLERGSVRVQSSPPEYYARPAINALFRSAAIAYGRRVIGVILTGRLNDGVAGLWEIKERGGVTIVQNPEEALCRSMPESALKQVEVDYCVPLAGLAPLLTKLTQELPAPPPLAGPQTAKLMIVEDERIVAKNLERRLAEFGYQIIASVSSGEAALTAAKAQLPDVVLMDIHLPGAIDGTDAAALLWRKSQVPVIYITAHTDSETIDRIKRTQPYGYVVKPFEPVEIHAAIQLALNRREKEEAADRAPLPET